MSFEEILDHAMAMLQRRGRVTYRTLKRQFQLDDDALEDLKAELIKGQRLAVDEDGEVLVWTGGASPPPGAMASPPPPWGGAHADQHPGDAPPPAEPPTSDAERRQLTVMFCDLVDSTPLAGHLDPEDYRAIVRAYLETCAQVIQRFDGYVAKYLGDGILVYFGYPRAHEDDAHRAVYAGLGIIDAIAQLNGQLTRDQGLRLAVRLGIHTGLVVAGDLGGGATREPLAIVGETPNIAARLQGVAEPNTVVISAATYQLVQGFFVCQDLGRPPLKGVATPLQVYRIEGERATESRFEAGRATGLTPLIGRDEELGLILRRWAQARAGEGQVVLLTGEPGIGKSRLLEAVRKRLSTEPHLRLPYQGSPYHTNSAFYPIIVQLARAAGFEPGDPPTQKLDKLEALLTQAGTRGADVAPLLAALLSLPAGDRYPPLPLSPQRQKALTIAAFVDHIVGLSRRQPVLCLVEDAHWCDPTSLEVLERLVHQVPELRVLVVITSRPEFTVPWMASHTTALTLTRLSRTQVAAMVEHLTTGKALPPEVLAHILDKTDGVPLFVEELTKTVLESGLLQDVGERYALTGPLPPLAIPSTVQDSLMARLDRLASAKEVAQLGAVLGREFAYAVLAAVSTMNEPALSEALAQLVGAGLLFRRGRPPEAHYRFKHTLVQEAAYASLLKSTRQQLHMRIATVLEARFPAMAETEPEVLARHYTEAGLPAQALPYCQQAGARAWSRAAFREAVAFFEQALQALAHLHEPGDTRGLAIELRLALGEPLIVLGEYKRYLALLGEAEALARALDDRARLGLVLAKMAQVLRTMGDVDGAIAAGQQALALATALGNRVLQGQAAHHLGQACQSLGDFRRAAELLRQNVEAADREPGTLSTDLRIRSQAWLARTLSALGAFAEGRRHGEEALRLAMLEGPGNTPIIVYGCLGLLYLAQGDLEPAIQVLDQGLALCRASDDQDWLRPIAAGLGYAFALQGRVAEGRVLVEKAISEGLRTGALQNHALWVAWLSEVCRLAGRDDEAWQHARRALDVVWQLKERGNEGHALHQLGTVQAHATPPDVVQAETHYQQALALAEALGMRPLQAHCHRGLGTLYTKIGRAEQARTELSAAITLYRAMDMTFWLPEAERALAEVKGP
jgi:class 3 adenylate cyclase/tetratricopeptide (TPR) repeat protein